MHLYILMPYKKHFACQIGVGGKGANMLHCRCIGGGKVYEMNEKRTGEVVRNGKKSKTNELHFSQDPA